MVDIRERMRAHTQLLTTTMLGLGEAIEAEQFLTELAQRAARTLHDACTIFVVASDGALIGAAGHADDEALLEQLQVLLKTSLVVDESPQAAELLRTGKPVLYPLLDIAAFKPRVASHSARFLDRVAIRSLIAAPMRCDGRSVGIITMMRHRTTDPFDDADLECVQALANAAALKLTRTRSDDRLHGDDASRVAAASAKRANAFLDAIVEHIPDMVFVKEAGRLSFIRFNRAGEQLLGLSRDNLLGKTDYDFFPPSEAEFFQAKDRETLKAGVLVEIPEEPIQTQAGQRWLHTKKVPILDDNGEPRYLLGISRDITERKRVDTELREAKAHAEAMNHELESFSYSVAHDLRTPLRAIDGFSKALAHDYANALDDKALKLLGRVRDAAKRMGTLIDDLLGLSRVTRLEVHRSQVDLSALAEAVVTRLRQGDSQRQVTVTIAPNLRVDADGRLLEIALDNLLGNAWKFTSSTPAPRIELGVIEHGHPRTFYVRDNGAGFDMAYAKRLFGVFQRLHSESEYPGTGIGLATVARIVQRHQGQVWADSKLGAGATFYFTLESSRGLG
ncbi:MAG: ATP-binding protein [Kofleriaceae bacterium]